VAPVCVLLDMGGRSRGFARIRWTPRLRLPVCFPHGAGMLYVIDVWKSPATAAIQTIQAENSYCPSCGLPQLVYAADSPGGKSQPEHWNESVRDAGSGRLEGGPRAALRWRFRGVALRGYPFIGFFGLVVDGCGGSLASLPLPAQPEATLDTIGAGARIGW